MTDEPKTVRDYVSVPRNEFNALIRLALTAEKLVLNHSLENVGALQEKLFALGAIRGWEFLSESLADVPLPAPPAEVRGEVEDAK